MSEGLTAAYLIAFERDIAGEFNAGRIRAPIHLDGNNEDQLIAIFREIAPDDWIAGSWRQHYHCLLKGVPPEKLKAEIMAGRSICLNFPEHRVLSSAIVGGVISQALGIALSIKRRGAPERVHVFLGDMTATTGAAHECSWYALGHDLPIRFIVEDNRKSVCSDTRKVWGGADPVVMLAPDDSYDYELPFPHAGAGKRVQF